MAKYQEWLTESKLTLLGGWARDGLSDEQIAHNIGISRDTLISWKKKYKQIADTLKENKATADYQVENALFKKAIGFTDERGRYYPPDIAAQIFWLKNRRPDKWKDKVENTNTIADDAVTQQFIDALNQKADIWKKQDEK